MSLPTISGGATFASVSSAAITNFGNGVFFIHTLNAEGQYSVDGGGVWYTFPTINQIRVMRITANELLVQRDAGTAKVYMIPEEAEFLV